MTLVRFFRAAARTWRDPETRALVILTLVMLVGGTFFYRQAEGWTVLDSLYFSVITLTTVGYGDLSPTTPASKLFTIFYLLLGIGIILAFVNAVAKNAMQRRESVREEAAEDLDKE